MCIISYMELKDLLKKKHIPFLEIVDSKQNLRYLEHKEIKIFPNLMIWKNKECIGRFDGDFDKLKDLITNENFVKKTYENDEV